MPYAAAQASKGVTVYAVNVSLEVSPGPPWVAEQQVTLRARVTYDGSPASNVLVGFFIRDVETGWDGYLGDARTDGNGYATITTAVPYELDGNPIPCGEASFRAVHYATGASSPEVRGKVAYPTSITISAPDSVLRGQPFTVSGMLTYKASAIRWAGLPNRTVSIYYNGTKLADVRTGSDGSYSAQVSIPASGSFTLRAVYPGEGLSLGPLGALGAAARSAARPASRLAPAAIGLLSLLLSL